ncbi:MAG: hypothetical protein DRQ59_00415 [Gammaproteobacteria bacterium]|nr:MAG: hypothetical protein DRQ59_00415 [Gammaproteobacteria bacterium]
MQAKSSGLSDIMETSCSHCQSRFQITEQQLQIAHGKVRCGECDEVFNALTSLKNHDRRQPIEYQPSPADGTAVNAEPKLELSLHEAMYGHKYSMLSHMAPLLWLIGILVLSTLGIAQAIYYQRYPLVQTPRFQQQVLGLCRVLPCNESQFSSTHQIKLLERNVFTHPVQSGALMVSGSFVNQASFAQKFPQLLVSLFDIQGNLIANRLFNSTEYLQTDRNRTVMEIAKPVQFRLEIVDPGTDALTYEFEFL